MQLNKPQEGEAQVKYYTSQEKDADRGREEVESSGGQRAEGGGPKQSISTRGPGPVGMDGGKGKECAES